jgi:hypothetical protein
VNFDIDLPPTSKAGAHRNNIALPIKNRFNLYSSLERHSNMADYVGINQWDKLLHDYQDIIL